MITPKKMPGREMTSGSDDAFRHVGAPSLARIVHHVSQHDAADTPASVPAPLERSRASEHDDNPATTAAPTRRATAAPRTRDPSGRPPIAHSVAIGSGSRPHQMTAGASGARPRAAPASEATSVEREMLIGAPPADGGSRRRGGRTAGRGRRAPWRCPRDQPARAPQYRG